MGKSFKTAKTTKLFLDECREYLDSLDHDLVVLEGGEFDNELIKRIKRHVHTLKGSSAMLEFNDVSKISHQIEDVIAKMEPVFPNVDQANMSAIFDFVDRIKEIVAKIESGEYVEGEADTAPPAPQQEAPKPPPPKPPEPPPARAEAPKPAPPPPPPPPPPPAVEPAADAKPEPPPLPPGDRVDLLSVLGDRLKGGLDRCFRIFHNIESKFVLAAGEELDSDLLDSLFDDTQYLFSTLVPIGVPAITHLLYRLRLVLDSIKEGKIPRSDDLVDFAFSGISMVRAIVENRMTNKPDGQDQPLAKWHAAATKKLNMLSDDKDIITEDTAIELFRRLSLDEQVASLLQPFEKLIIAQSMIHDNRVFLVSFVVSAGDREVLVSLPEASKAFYEKGNIMAVLYRLTATPAGLAYNVIFFFATDIHEEELEELSRVLEDVKDIRIKHISFVDQQAISVKPREERSAAKEEAAAPPAPEAAAEDAAAAARAARAAKVRRKDGKLQSAKGGAQTTVRVDTEKLDVLVNLIAELVINHNKMEQEIRALKQFINQVGEIFETLRSGKKAAFEHSYQERTLESLLQPLRKMDAMKLSSDFLADMESATAVVRGFIDSQIGLREEISNLYEQAVEGEKNIDQMIDSLGSLKKDLDTLFLDFQDDEINIGRVIDDLQEETMKLRMLPISQVFNKFPRRVRDIARDMNKMVSFSISGEETELDKTLIEEIEEPLLHLIRNAIDHGLETTEERLKKNKTESGTIRMNAYHEGNSVVVVVEDDGKGIDPQKIKMKAVEKRLISPEEAAQMDERAAINLIFTPGFSTKDQVSDLSGRGVGMDVVKNNIQKLKGLVDVQSVVDEGTAFKLKLPLTLAIIQAMIVKCRGMKFVIPMDTIKSTDMLTADKCLTIESKDVFKFQDKDQDRVLPLVRLADVFNLGQDEGPEISRPVVVVHGGDEENKIGIIVDEVIEKQQVVIKTLGTFLGEVRHIVGATIFGDGSIALIIDIGGIIQSVSQIVQRAQRRDDVTKKKTLKRILLVDDSLSGRIAQRDMLERMGFSVEVASSGFQALEILHEKTFDAVVTDINMPRMDGYEFTSRMRSDPKTRNVPVIMVTSDIKRADRQKGFDVGVNEFLAKPFSDEDLQAAIEKHI